MTVTKKDLADELWQTMGLTKLEALRMVEVFFDAIKQSIVSDGELKMSRFGAFSVREKRARPGRNPRNGEPYAIKARRVVTFKASPMLRECCNPGLPARRGNIQKDK
jgi:integration host factor subunit alpha